MERYFHEVRTEVRRMHDPIIVEVGEVIPPSEYNFRSTFDYPQEVADSIKAAGNTVGLKGLPVSCAEIYVDVDEEENVEEVREILLSLGLAFDEYRTGNRGRHYHIPLSKRITGVDVIHTVTSWLKKIHLWHLIDTSVYREGGQFRMESAIHQKTSKKKVLVEEVDGDLLELELVAPSQEARVRQASIGNGSQTEFDFFMNLLTQRGVGGRHPHLYILWKCGLNAGLDIDTIHRSMLEWNARQDNPHSEDVMMKKLRSFV